MDDKAVHTGLIQ